MSLYSLRRNSKLATISSNQSDENSDCARKHHHQIVLVATNIAGPLSNGRKYVDVQLLSREHLYLAVDGTDLIGNPSAVIYLRVHTFVDCIGYIKCPTSLFHYYLQLRENARVQWEPSWVREERCFEAAAYALQADYGDYSGDTGATCDRIVFSDGSANGARRPSNNEGNGDISAACDRATPSYFQPDAYFPHWVVQKRGVAFLTRHAPKMHADLSGATPHSARIQFCREVARGPWAVNSHLYGARRRRNDRRDNVYIGVTPRGLEFFDKKESGERDPLCSLIWSKIGKVAFERRKFCVCSVDNCKNLTFYTNCDEKSRYLLSFCRSVHQNLMSMQQEIMEARKAEFQESRQFRESYIYSDNNDFEFVRNRGHLPFDFSDYSNIGWTPQKLISGQRISLVSDASSNTTSGIVSDRQQNHDDSENDNDYDIDFDVADSPVTAAPSSTTRSSCNIFITAAAAPSADGPTSPFNRRSAVTANNRSATVVSVGENDACGFVCGEPSLPKRPVRRRRSTDGHGDGSKLSTVKIDGSGGGPDVDSGTDVSCTLTEADLPGEEPSTLQLVAGPSSDKTIATLSDDAQSTCTTSTTEKLDDCADVDFLMTDVRKISATPSESVNFSERPIQSADAQIASKTPDDIWTTKKVSNDEDDVIDLVESQQQKQLGNRRTSADASKMTIAELRRLTLNGFNVPKSHAEIASRLPHSEVINSVNSCSHLRQMKSLATQTNGSYLSCYPKNVSRDQTPDTDISTTLQHQPSTSIVVINNDNPMKKDYCSHDSKNSSCKTTEYCSYVNNLESRNGAYRIIASSASVDGTPHGCCLSRCQNTLEKSQGDSTKHCQVFSTPPLVHFFSHLRADDLPLTNQSRPICTDVHSMIGGFVEPTANCWPLTDGKTVENQWPSSPLPSDIENPPPAYMSAVRHRPQYEQRSTNGKRWPTISGVDGRDLAVIGGPTFMSHYQVSQAQSEPRLAGLESTVNNTLWSNSNSYLRCSGAHDQPLSAYHPSHAACYPHQHGPAGYYKNAAGRRLIRAADDVIDGHVVGLASGGLNSHGNGTVGSRRHSACCIASSILVEDDVTRHFGDVDYAGHGVTHFRPSGDDVTCDKSVEFVTQAQRHGRSSRDVARAQSLTVAATDRRRQLALPSSSRRLCNQKTSTAVASRPSTTTQNCADDAASQSIRALCSLSNGRYDDFDDGCCDRQEEEEDGPLDWDELKHILSSRAGMDLPMVRALCDDRSLQDVRCCKRERVPVRPPDRPLAARSSHPILPTDPSSLCCRPQSWHESNLLLSLGGFRRQSAISTKLCTSHDHCRLAFGKDASPCENFAPSIRDGNFSRAENGAQIRNDENPRFYRDQPIAARFASTPNLHDPRLPPPPPYYRNDGNLAACGLETHNHLNLPDTANRGSKSGNVAVDGFGNAKREGYGLPEILLHGLCGGSGTVDRSYGSETVNDQFGPRTANGPCLLADGGSQAYNLYNGVANGCNSVG